MKKILIVGENDLIVETLKMAFLKKKTACIIASYDEALNNFFAEEPRVIIVCDSDTEKGKQAFADLQNSASEEKIIGIGFGKNDSDDYLQMPFELKELFKRLKI
jgi:DNA-binding response OmpR family regulator